MSQLAYRQNITPEMIRAGVEELSEKTLGEKLEDIVVDVFIAMTNAQETI